MISPGDSLVASGSPERTPSEQARGVASTEAAGSPCPIAAALVRLILHYAFRDLHVQFRLLEERGTARRRRTGPCARDVGGVNIPLFQWCLMHSPSVGKRGQPLQ
jgi:hypothetical protein